MADAPPETRYTLKDDAHLAYQAIGSGDLDVLFIDTWVHHVEAVWDVPDFARLLRRLGSLGRLIHFDRRGTGLSDPVPLDHLPDFDAQVEDVIAILDAVGADLPSVIGTNDGTLVAILLAAAYPERCRALVLFAPTAKHELPTTPETQDVDAVLELISRNVEDSGLDWLAPSRTGDDAFDRQVNRLQRNAVRPAAMRHYFRQTFESDVGGLLPAIRVPTLVINRAENRVVSARESP
jgi:pimeloyl-ACP methyl ester carboxylesterase